MRLLLHWLHRLVRPCRCEVTRRADAYLDAVKPLRPRVHRDTTALLHTAAIYEELERMEGWRDFIGRVKEARTQLQETVLRGRFNPNANPRNLSYDELQSTLFALDLVVNIPAVAAESFTDWRAAEDARLKAATRFDERVQA